MSWTIRKHWPEENWWNLLPSVKRREKGGKNSPSGHYSRQEGSQGSQTRQGHRREHSRYPGTSREREGRSGTTRTCRGGSPAALFLRRYVLHSDFPLQAPRVKGIRSAGGIWQVSPERVIYRGAGGRTKGCGRRRVPLSRGCEPGAAGRALLRAAVPTDRRGNPSGPTRAEHPGESAVVRGCSAREDLHKWSLSLWSISFSVGKEAGTEREHHYFEMQSHCPSKALLLSCRHLKIRRCPAVTFGRVFAAHACLQLPYCSGLTPSPAKSQLAIGNKAFLWTHKQLC